MTYRLHEPDFLWLRGTGFGELRFKDKVDASRHAFRLRQTGLIPLDSTTTHLQTHPIELENVHEVFR